MRERPIQFVTRAAGCRLRVTAFAVALALVAALPAQDLSDERADGLLDFFEVDPDDGDAMYDGFERYLKRYGKAVDEFESETDKAGQPDVEGGDKVRKAVKAFATEERKSNEAASKDLKALDKSEDDLAADVDDIFFDIEFADLRALLEDSEAADSGRIIELIEKDSSCAFALFAE